MARPLSPTSNDTQGPWQGSIFSAPTTIASISSPPEPRRGVVAAATQSIDATRFLLYNYRQYSATFPDLVEENVELFQLEFDRLNEQLGNAFKLRHSRFQYIRFWESPDRIIQKLEKKMSRLKGRIVSASAEVETEMNDIAQGVQSQLMHELDCELLEEYLRRKPVKTSDFVADVVRPRATRVLPPSIVELYVTVFTHRLQNPDGKRNLKPLRREPSTTSHHSNSSAPDTPANTTSTIQDTSS